MNKKIIILILIISSQGCMFLSTGNSEIKLTQNEMDVYNKAKNYYGRTSFEVEQDYGKPANIRKNVRKNLPEGVTEYYDEVWFYRYSEGIPLLAPRVYGVTFYFKDGKVARVSG